MSFYIVLLPHCLFHMITTLQVIVIIATIATPININCHDDSDSDVGMIAGDGNGG